MIRPGLACKIARGFLTKSKRKRADSNYDEKLDTFNGGAMAILKLEALIFA
jgi:hypothetical protein